MSATDQMRAMLDQLMGTTRNGDDGRGLKFSDNRVCKSFLLDCCPHDILASTRMDLGECPKIHDLAFRADYENASKTRDYYYDIEAMEHLQAFIADCDRRTEAAKQRLKETQEELTAEVAEKANAVHALAEEIGKKLAKAESLGEAGEVEESMALMKEIEELRTKKVRAEHEYRTSMPASTYQQQKLRVCEVCSAYLGIHDNDIRLADHFGGKLHLGFLTIREKLVELEKTAGPRKVELKRAGKIQDRDDKRQRGRYFVGGRELDRRSRVHRSRSRERQRRTEERRTEEANNKNANDNNTTNNNNNNNNSNNSIANGSSASKNNSNPSIASSSTNSNPNIPNSSLSSFGSNTNNNNNNNNNMSSGNNKNERSSRGSGRDRNERSEQRPARRSRSRSATYSSKHKSSSSRRRSRSRNRYNSRR